jgi:glycosyltransferase involved in cell wall biosynthesis
VIQELRHGGAERVVVSLVHAAERAGHEAAVASAGGALAAELDVPQFAVPMLGRRPWLVPGAALAVRGAVRAFRPDLVHCHNPGMAAVVGLATLRGRLPPGLVSVHGVPDADYRAAARVLRASGLAVVACGPGVDDGLAAHGIRPAATIPNGVSAAQAPANRAALERELGIPAGAPLVVASGRLVAVKNHALALAAIRDVPDAWLALLGEGPLRDELAAAAGDRVLLAGLRDDARAIVGAADAFVFTSHGEGLPLVVLEALAAGTPLVATAVRGVRELVRDGESALLVRPGDAAALAAALRSVLADPQLAARLREGGLAVAAAHGEQAMVDAYLALGERLAR